MTPQQQNPDGSWSDATALGWRGGLDWEVYIETSPKRADLYDEDILIGVVTARTRAGLARKMRREMRRHTAPSREADQ